MHILIFKFFSVSTFFFINVQFKFSNTVSHLSLVLVIIKYSYSAVLLPLYTGHLLTYISKDQNPYWLTTTLHGIIPWYNVILKLTAGLTKMQKSGPAHIHIQTVVK